MLLYSLNALSDSSAFSAFSTDEVRAIERQRSDLVGLQ